MEVSLGEIFELAINAIDENGSSKDAIYSYRSPTNLTIRPLNNIVVDLNLEEDTLPSFASVNRATMQNSPYTVQKLALVLHSAEQLENICVVNYQNSKYFNLSFSFNLIDSSNGQVVCINYSY